MFWLTFFYGQHLVATARTNTELLFYHFLYLFMIFQPNLLPISVSKKTNHAVHEVNAKSPRNDCQCASRSTLSCYLLLTMVTCNMHYIDMYRTVFWQNTKRNILNRQLTQSSKVTNLSGQTHIKLLHSFHCTFVSLFTQYLSGCCNGNT